jgi:hypothetical protein
MRVQQDLKTLLTKWYEGCARQGNRELHHETRLARNWIRTTPALAMILGEAKLQEPAPRHPGVGIYG